MTAAVALARCMRAHGVPNFPDPARTLPRNPSDWSARYSRVGILGGLVYAMPKSIDPQSPFYTRALAACNQIGAVGPGPPS